MTTMLDIAAVAAATGLSSRALRFYEARGLIRPLRTTGGRRVFGAGELERLHAIVALKRAGFTLAAIGRMLERPDARLGPMIAAQRPWSRRSRLRWPKRPRCYVRSSPASMPASASTSRRSAR